jgi:hypothetical protein
VRPLPRSRHVPRRIRGALDRQRDWQMNRRLRRREVHRLRQMNGRRL